MSSEDRFSERFGYSVTEAEITVRQDAPTEFRHVLPELADESGLTLGPLRSVICLVLRKRPDPNNWSERPIAEEVSYLIDNCEWFKVYDVVEEIYKELAKLSENPGYGQNGYQPQYFERELNKYFRQEGIGWQLVEGVLQVRGSESFEDAVNRAKEVLDETGRLTAKSEIHQALQDLSRRPEPDITGAIQHAMAALECIARDVCGDPKPTLGELLKNHQGLLPAPLDQVVVKAWGYASEYGRHLREGRDPEMYEAELIVGLSATLATYLSNKTK